MNAALRDLFKEELQEANEKGFACAIIGLVKDGLLTVEIGADRMHITVDEMKHLLAQN